MKNISKDFLKKQLNVGIVESFFVKTGYQNKIRRKIEISEKEH